MQWGFKRADISHSHMGISGLGGGERETCNSHLGGFQKLQMRSRWPLPHETQCAKLTPLTDINLNGAEAPAKTTRSAAKHFVLELDKKTTSLSETRAPASDCA